MSAWTKLMMLERYNFCLSTQRRHLLWSLVVSLFVILLLSAKVEAAPCFDDPKRAYQYLLEQEQSVRQARTQTRININRATEGELTSLSGIGSSKARAIVLYRDMFGPFKSVDALTKVKGIGPKTIEKNRARLQVGD